MCRGVCWSRPFGRHLPTLDIFCLWLAAPFGHHWPLVGHALSGSHALARNISQKCVAISPVLRGQGSKCSLDTCRWFSRRGLRMGAGKRATQPRRIWMSDSLRSVALTLAFGFIGGRLAVELSPVHRCRILNGFAPHHVFWRDTAPPTAILTDSLGAFFFLAI